MTFPIVVVDATYFSGVRHPYAVTTGSQYLFSASKGAYTNHDTLEAAQEQAEELAGKGWRGLRIERQVLGPLTRP